MDESNIHETSQTVGKVFKVVGGGTPPTSVSRYWQGSIPWITSADLDENLKIAPRKSITKEAIDASATNLVPAGSVIVATRVGLGKVGVAQKPMCFSQDCQGLVVDLKTCDPKFVALQLKQRVQIFRYISRGTTISGVTKKQLLDLPFALPLLAEQQRLVAEIEKQFSRLDEAVASLKRTKANLKRCKAAVLKAAVEGKLTEDWRKQHPDIEPASKLLERILAERRAKWKSKRKYKEPTGPDTNELPSLPKGWTWASLEMIGQHDRPIIYGIIKPGPHIPDGVPYVRVTEMKNGRVDFKNLRRTTPERAAKFARATLAPGDVLISKDGTIGRVAVVPPELKGGNITQHVMRAPVHSLMVRDFVVWAIRSDFCQRWLTGETRGVALQGVNVEDFRRLPVPIPSYGEQEQIVAEVERRLSVIDELEVAVEANLTRADRLRQAILAASFSGRVMEHLRIDTCATKL